MLILKRIILSLLFFLVFPVNAQIFEDYSHPELEWQTFETDHFIFHFHQGTQRTAFAAAKIFEDIYPAITELYQYKPENKTHVIIKDTDDYSNGAAYFFDDKMEIWATNLDYVMRGTKNWLRDVITHEFVHMVSIQKTIKTNLTFPYGFLQIFAYEEERRKDVVRGFPNVLVSYPLSSINMPVWFAEGTAQYQSNKKRFDYRDPHREMIIRDRILNEQLLTYNEMSVFGKTSHGNESSYNLGFSFVNYLSERFGEDVLRKITEVSSKWSSYTFEGVLEEVTGIPSDSLYQDWKDQLTEKYLNKTEIIRKNLVKGEAIENQGFGNLYPQFIPGSKDIVYVTNRGSDYFSQNYLELYDAENKSKKQLTSFISSSISVSADGRYVLYSKQKKTSNQSSFNDLFLYDLKEDKEIRLTKNLRGSNPDFSNDGKKIVFVGSTNGLHQLNILHLSDDLDSEKWSEVSFNIETGAIESETEEKPERRLVRFRGKKIDQLLTFQDGRQIYHPRWSNDDQSIIFDTAVEYGRNLGIYRFSDKSFELFMEAEEELRYPEFRKDSDWLYYSASTTGIYNLYRYNLKTNQKELLSNVTGGAFMPSIADDGDIVYACYDSIGYKIFELENPQPIDPAVAVYDQNYIARIPDKNFDDSNLQSFETVPYKETFPALHILPRILIDYETVKPGLYLVTSDVLNQLNMVAGAVVNSDFDYDLYGYFDYRKFGPDIFLEVINVSAGIDDTLSVLRGGIDTGLDRYALFFKRDVTFNLLQARMGISYPFAKGLRATAALVYNRFSAKLGQTSEFSEVENTTVVIPTIRYDYLKGLSFQTSVVWDAIKADRFRDVNPSGGFYLFARHSYEVNEFITGFATDRQLSLEEFTTYRYHSIELNGELYFKNPLIKSHALGLHLKGGYIDRRVDSFFNFFAGGLLGLKGYPFYSIEGRQKLITALTYRFPISRGLDWRLGHLQFDKLYMGFFAEYGNAFDRDEIILNDFKRDVGVELRLDSFSYNLFPTRFFLQAAYPLEQVENGGVKYPKEWRWYLGVLFDFDLRERFNSLSRLKLW